MPDRQLKKLVCLSDFREAAKLRMKREAFQYIDSGSEDQKTMKDNQISFHKLMIIPRILTSSSTTYIGTTIFGRQFNLPFGFAPWAMNTLAHPQGQLIPARIAHQNKMIYGLSTLSTKSYAEVEASNKDGVRFMQMYISNDWNLTKAIIKLAQKYHFAGLAITVDAQVLGIRRREKETVLDTSKIHFPVLQEMLQQSNSSSTIKQRKSNLANRDLSMNWQTIKKIRSMTNLKIVLKGIMHPKDAALAVDYCDAIWISNHGGRQLDSISSTINILPNIKAAVGDKIPIFIDGGIRTGNDIYKCIALGANYVFLARPIAYCLVFGYQGLTKMVKILQEELRRAMILVGCQTLKDIKAESVVPEPSL